MSSVKPDIIANPDAPGKAIALYTCAPSRELAIAELRLLLEKVLRKHPNRKIIGFYDLDSSLDVGSWLKKLKGKDRKRLLELMEEDKENTGFSQKLKTSVT